MFYCDGRVKECDGLPDGLCDGLRDGLRDGLCDGLWDSNVEILRKPSGFQATADFHCDFSSAIEEDFNFALFLGATLQPSFRL